MKRTLPAVLALALGVAGASTAEAQDSVFGIRGLGFLDRSISGRSAALGGGFALFDPGVALNPASLGAWHNTAGWMVASGQDRSFATGLGTSSLSATRFPVAGFAGLIGERWVVGITASDYLDRNWSVQQTDTVYPRGTAVVANDNTQSAGGITDLRLAAAYRVPGLTLGLGLHVLTGSTQTSVSRQFPDDSSFIPFNQAQTTDYRGVGVSFGAMAGPSARLVFGASVRFNGRLRASTSSASADIPMPIEMSGGVYWQPVTGLALSSTVGYAGWASAADALAAAGQARSRNVWNVGLGAELLMLKSGRNFVPLRLGYRWRGLPFPIPGDSTAAPSPLAEHAVTAGLGFDTASNRATVDLALEFGSRTAGALSERFTTLLLGLTIRP